LRDIKKIIGFLPSKRQNLMFSATFSNEIKTLANGFLKNPVLIEVSPENSTVEKVIQKVYRVPKSKKSAFVTQLITDGNWHQVLMFTRTKHRANNLTKKLLNKGISAAAIHGNKSQVARTKALREFKQNVIRVLVATDIAARGLDIPLLPHVINFELPNVPEDYVHRIGRTGRAGASGEAISLVANEELEYVRGIEKLLKQKLQIEEIEGFDFSEDERQESSTKKQHQQRPQRKKQGERKSFSRKPKGKSQEKSSSEEKRTNPRRNKRRDNRWKGNK